jgi:hypothetical protein
MLAERCADDLGCEAFVVQLMLNNLVMSNSFSYIPHKNSTT